jgi:hypothetical protein
MLWLLVRQRLRESWNRLVRGRHGGRRLLGAVAGIVFSVGFVLLAGNNAGLLIDRLAVSNAGVAASALAVLLVGVVGLTVVTSLSSAFHHLFMAGDLELLLAAPVPPRSLFWLKVLEVWRDSVHVLLFQAAALLAFGRAIQAPFTFYPLAAILGLALTLGAAVAGASATLVTARVRHGASLLGLSRALAVVLFLPIGVLGIPALGLGRGRVSLLVSQESIRGISNTLDTIGPPPVWAPTTWAAHVLLGDEAATLSIGLLVATGVALVLAAGLVYDAMAQPAWERVRFSGASLASSASTTRRWRWPTLGAPAGPIVGVLQKDWRTLIRDPRWRTGAIVSLIALCLPALVLFAGDPFARGGHAVRFWFGMLPVPYLAYLFGSQQGAATLSYEGRNIALLRAAPVAMERILFAKLSGGLMLVMTVTGLLTLGLAIAHDGQPLEIGAAVLASSWLAIGATLAAVAGAALTADFEGDNPQRRVGCLGTIVTSALSITFFVTNTALLGWWVTRTVLSVPRPLGQFLPYLDWGLLLLALASVGALVVASRFGMRRLSNWEIS